MSLMDMFIQLRETAVLLALSKGEHIHCLLLKLKDTEFRIILEVQPPKQVLTLIFTLILSTQLLGST